MWKMTVVHIFSPPFGKAVVRLPADLVAYLDEFFVKRGATRSAVVASLIATHPSLADWRARVAPGVVSGPFAEHVAGIPQTRPVFPSDELAAGEWQALVNLRDRVTANGRRVDWASDGADDGAAAA